MTDRPVRHQQQATEASPLHDQYAAMQGPHGRQGGQAKPEQAGFFGRSNPGFGFPTFESASQKVGGLPWETDNQIAKDTGYGKFGCSVLVAQRMGINPRAAETVGQLVNVLKGKGYHQIPVDQAQAGDVVVMYNSANWRKGGGDAHVGIVEPGGRVWNNKGDDKSGYGPGLDTMQSFLARRSGGNFALTRRPGT